MINRVIWIILDSVGIGALGDAKEYGDEGAFTLKHVLEQKEGIDLSNLKKLGLGKIDAALPLGKETECIGCYGKAKEISKGKDTTIGHWEMVGIHTKIPFRTYPNGFSDEIMQEFIKRCNVGGYLGNCVASGTKIIEELGDEHVKTGYPIIYTSADSVFQIAAHEEVIPLERLYEMCHIARKLLVGDNSVSRVIARPFIGTSGNYVRTSNRHDYSVKPEKENLLNYLNESGIPVIGIGKIHDIFDGEGISETIYTKDNMDGVDKTLKAMQHLEKGLIFTNLVEFDSKWGHRRDAKGYLEGLLDFDARLEELMEQMREGDLLIINADHGCDPTFKGTDHTREYIPILLYGESIKKGVNIGIRNSFADIGQSIAEIFGTKTLKIGQSFMDKLC
ncbi:MAG: phosphopentomutase [Lachnospiraceae bacterium]|nr:phosphopentomutase [Lachnospiraceae bacterium]